MFKQDTLCLSFRWDRCRAAEACHDNRCLGSRLSRGSFSFVFDSILSCYICGGLSVRFQVIVCIMQKIEQLQKYARNTKKKVQNKSQKVIWKVYVSGMCIIIVCSVVFESAWGIFICVFKTWTGLQYQWKVETQRLNKRQNVIFIHVAALAVDTSAWCLMYT